jgi:protein ImuA
VTAFLLRFNAVPDASSAETRWTIRAGRSNPQDDNWGMPRFDAELVRNRHGRTGHWVMEWNCDEAKFREPADRGVVDSAPRDRPAAAAMEGEERRAFA